MTAYIGNGAMQQSKLLSKVAGIVENAMQPGVLLLVLLALVSLLSGLANPEVAALYGMPF